MVLRSIHPLRLWLLAEVFQRGYALSVRQRITSRIIVLPIKHDSLAASLDPPSTNAIVDFDGGGRAAFEVTDRDPDQIQVGIPVEMTFRKLFFDRGIHNYYWKATPIRSQQGE